MANLGMFFKALGTKIATLWKTTTWFKIASIGGAVVIAASGVVIPNAIISETGGIFHKCDFSVENIDANYSYSAANCTDKAKYYYSCACGEKGTELFEYGNALGHDLTHHESKQVTCIGIGFDAYDTCSRCDYTTYIEIPATGHTDGEWITDTNATCTEDGSKHQICSVCNDTIKTTVIPATGHTDGNWITDVNATCTKDGSKHQICSVCSDTINTEVISATGHTDGEWITDANATCTKDGSKHQICSVCNDAINTAVIPATGHTWGDWVNDLNPKCDADGARHRGCLSCSTQENEIISKLGHQKSKLLSTEEINDAFFGTWRCDRCDNNFSEEYIPLSATIFNKKVNFNYGIPYYSWNVNPSGGVGEYTMSYFVYEFWTGKVVLASGNIMTPDNPCIHLDTKDYSVTSGTLAVRVFVYDGVGTVAYDFILNNGKFGDIFDSWVSIPYCLEFIDNSANYA